MSDRSEGRKHRKERHRSQHRHDSRRRHSGGHRRREQRDENRPPKKQQTRCPYCEGRLRAKGASDSAGGLSWKCRDCGRRVWKRVMPKPPVPLVPVSYSTTNRAGG